VKMRSGSNFVTREVARDNRVCSIRILQSVVTGMRCVLYKRRAVRKVVWSQEFCKLQP